MKDSLEKDLFNECIEAFGTKVRILSDLESKKIWDLFEQELPIVDWGRVDWDKIDKKINVDCDPDKIIPALGNLLKKDFDKSIYVLWNDASVPVIKTNLDAVITLFDDVISVGPDTWLFNPSTGYIVEWYHEGELFVGLILSHKD